ncbi:restless-like transposase [Hirsutella rhossiliensis]|uniref:Restless-like transposase n=1 Tax=Hirsutella rhossiliensis TaxID=111463 RepID=A0A9P8N030_9HYPO|nr:restless-like transposase [Hirsutella rhossiliensis]KAH0964395.1 restless-like transposase [Hirsutella rhossiliensis]
MDAFLSKKQQLKEDLQRSRSRISISFDLWTSPNPYAILGVVAMWIDATGKRRSTVLGMRRVHGEHSGENLGSTVLELLTEYDIGGDQIGYFMLDNASSNDTAVEFILKELCPWMKPQQRRHRRLRCLGHIVNLCCQAFLMGRNYGQHWFELEKIELALKDFFAATMLAEGNKTSLADWFSTLDCLLREINETKDHYHDIHEEDDDDNFTWRYLQVVQMLRGQSARSITATDNGIGNIDFLKILIFRQRITQLKYSIRIESGHGSGKNGFFRATKEDRSGMKAHSWR